MNIEDISTQIMFTTVPIYISYKDESVGAGTGFIYSAYEKDNSTIPFLITNFHVIEDIKVGCFELHMAEQGLPINETIKINFNEDVVLNNKLGELDLVAIPLASALNEIQKKKIEIFYRSIGKEIIPSNEQIKDLAAVENIIFVGYPNGLYDSVSKMSIVRQGITATPIWNKFQGNEAFLIDAGVFPGSSGSPVFIYNRGTYPTKDGIAVGNRIMFVGVISKTMKTANNIKSDFLDLGYVIRSDILKKELDELLKERYNIES